MPPWLECTRAGLYPAGEAIFHQMAINFLLYTWRVVTTISTIGSVEPYTDLSERDADSGNPPGRTCRLAAYGARPDSANSETEDAQEAQREFADCIGERNWSQFVETGSRFRLSVTSLTLAIFSGSFDKIMECLFWPLLLHGDRNCCATLVFPSSLSLRTFLRCPKQVKKGRLSWNGSPAKRRK